MADGMAILKEEARTKAESPLRQPHEESDGLRGLGNIAAYAQYGPKTVQKLIETAGFPAIQVEGAWESSKILIDDWRRKRILAELCQAVSDGLIAA
jgi:uncharacterized membrane-anchored protein